MINVVYRVVVKQNKVIDFKNLANKALIPVANDIPGCKVFSLLQNISNEQEFIFYEQWDSKQSIVSYKKKLIDLLGLPNPNEEFPKKLNNMIEHDEDIYVG